MNSPQTGNPTPESTPSLKLHSAGELTGASADESTTHHENGENTSMPPRNSHDDDIDAPHVASMDDEPSSAVQDPDKGAIPVKRKHAELDPEGKTEQDSDENMDEEGKQKKRKTNRVVLQAFVATLEGQGISTLSPTSNGPNQTQTASVGESTCLTNPPVVSNVEISKSEQATSSRPAIYIKSQHVAEKPPQTIGTREDSLKISVQTPPTTFHPVSPLAVQTSTSHTASTSELPQQTSAAHPSSGPPSRPPSSAPSWPPSHPASRPPSRAPAASHSAPFASPQPFGPPIPMGTVVPGPAHSYMPGGAQGPSNENLMIVHGHPQHSQQVNGRPPPPINQQQPCPDCMEMPVYMSHQAPPNSLPPGTNPQHPQHMPPPGQPGPMVMSPANANGPYFLPHPSVFHDLGVQLSPMSLATNPLGVLRSSVPLTQTRVAAKEERMIAQANYPAGAAAAVPTSVQRPPPPLQNAPSTPVAPNQARMIAQTNYPAGAAASAPPAMQHLPHPLQNTPSAPVAPNQARMIAQANYPAGAATSDPTSVQHPPPPLQNAPSAPAAPNQAQNNTAPTRQSRTIEAAADMLVQLIRDTAAVAATGAAADQAQNAQDKAQWVALLGKKERELEVERAERRKEVEEQRAQWQMEHRAREEEAVRSSRQIEQAERALLQREAEFEKERTQWREQRDSWARNLEQADRDKQEISQRLEMASNFEEERAQWEKIREALESEKTNNSQQIDQLRQQISLLTEKETKFGEERAEWEKERDAWKGETARVMKLFEQAEEQITQCLEKEKKFADERAQWGEEREALEADKARKSEEIGQLQKSVKVLDEKLRHSQVVGQTNGTETQKGAEQSQQRQGQVPSTFDVKAAETQEQGSTIQKLTERISSQDAYIARINAVATEKLKALQESSKQLREQNAVLVANAQRISQVLATYVNKTREWQTISKAVKSANAPSSLLAAKNAEVSVAWSEMERIVAALAAQGLPAGVGAQKPQPQGPNMPAMATEK